MHNDEHAEHASPSSREPISRREPITLRFPRAIRSSAIASASASATRPLRIAFVSYYAAFDPSNGAARSMRDLLHLLQGAGCSTSSFTGPCVEGRGNRRGHDVVLRAIVNEGLALDESEKAPLFASNDRGTPHLLYLPEVAMSSPEPSDKHHDEFLATAHQFLRATRPDVVLTYGSGTIARAIIQAAQAVKKVAVAMPMPTAIAAPLDWKRARVRDAEALGKSEGRKFLTYVAPTIEQGLPWAARILEELASRRPDIPLLVVEGRGNLIDLAKRLSSATRARITTMRSSAAVDPRIFLEKTRVLMMPSHREPSGRLAQEAILNDIPVVGSTCDGLAAALAEAGIRLPITTAYASTPSRDDVAEWVTVIERLWDDRTFFDRETARCGKAKMRWTPDRLAPEYLRFFASICNRDNAAELCTDDDDDDDDDAAMPMLDRARSIDVSSSRSPIASGLKTASLSELYVPE